MIYSINKYIIIIYTYLTLANIVYFIRNEEFLEHEGIINITISLQSTFFADLPDYIITVCLISDQWSTYNVYLI